MPSRQGTPSNCPVSSDVMTTTLLLLLAGLAQAETIAQAFPPPAGFVRVAAAPFGAWLQSKELHPAVRPVRTHTGQVVPHNARVVQLPLVPGDLQQCADSAIRLRAEWLKEQGEHIAFHATSGDLLPWARWQAGERPYAPGNKVLWRAGTRGGWEAYLSAVFMWAGTRSLAAYDTVADQTPHPGDLLVEGGSPGHAVVLLDVAESADGRVLVLVGEGYMPAQDFHVELGPHQSWWDWTDAGLEGFHWPLGADSLRAWR